jgi:hydroxymethylglutaryl-CoA lyase
MIKLVECPRDAMQGWKNFIPTQQKISYINQLLKVGFDTIDFGSFVSPKAIPQMADTKEVIKGLVMGNSESKLLAIVANQRGAEEAVVFDEISYLGFPFSISPTFQLLNTNSTIEESINRVAAIQDICIQHKKKLVLYVSMGFGNPYGDEHNEEIVLEHVAKIVSLGIDIISMADTVGLATPTQISSILKALIPQNKSVEIGVHLHSATDSWKQKLTAAFNEGCNRFDGALKGIGGCPMANNELVGNMDTELMIPYFKERGLLNNLNLEALAVCSKMASEIFL